MKIDKKICRYIQKRGDITLPEIMAELILDYMTAVSILGVMKKKKKIKQLDDFRYQYVAPKKKESKEDDDEFDLDFERMMETIDNNESEEISEITDDTPDIDNEFDDFCIKIIEKIVLSSSSITRAEALQKAAESLELFEGSTDTVMLAALQKAKEEFELCSNDEFLILRKQLHENEG